MQPHEADVQEEFVAGKSLELAGFAMFASVRGKGAGYFVQEMKE